MASRVFLGSLFGEQDKLTYVSWTVAMTGFRGTHDKALIAKGNIIEGIEAKE